MVEMRRTKRNERLPLPIVNEQSKDYRLERDVTKLWELLREEPAIAYMDFNLEKYLSTLLQLRIYATDVIRVSTWGRDSLFWGLAEISEDDQERVIPGKSFLFSMI